MLHLTIILLSLIELTSNNNKKEKEKEMKEVIKANGNEKNNGRVKRK